MLSPFVEERECATFHLDWKSDLGRVVVDSTNALERNRLPRVATKSSIQVDTTVEAWEEDLENWFVPVDM